MSIRSDVLSKYAQSHKTLAGPHMVVGSTMTALFCQIIMCIYQCRKNESLCSGEIENFGQCLLDDILQRRDADDFFKSDVDRFAVGLDAMDAGLADVDFAGRGGIPQVVDIDAF